MKAGASSGATEAPLLLFVHVPKCAGSSLRRSIIEPTIPESRIWRPGSWRNLLFASRDSQYLIGHFPYGIHHLFRPGSALLARSRVYFSVVRDPIEQMVSLYRYYCRLGINQTCDRGNASVAEFIRSNRFENMQCRAHAGLAWWWDHSPIAKLSRHRPDLLLRRAKRSIRRHYSYFLLQSCLDEQLLQLAEHLGLEYRRDDEPSTRTDRDHFMAMMQPKEIEELTRLAKADIGLFEWISGNVSEFGIAVRSWRE